MGWEDALVDVLAAFVAARRYSYVDRVGNSLEPLTALEALRDALRDFESSCRGGGYLEEDRARGVCVRCPEVSPSDLERAVGEFERLARGNRRVFLGTTRGLALKALGRARRFLTGCGGGGL